MAVTAGQAIRGGRGYRQGKKGRPPGTGHYPYREDEERERVCDLIEAGTSNEDIAAAIGWSVLEVRDTRARFYPTKGLAERYLRANALRMAMRVVEEANVEETIDILSRPNIGVLAPAMKPGSGPQIGIFTNISLESLGGIQAPPVEIAAQAQPHAPGTPLIEGVVQDEPSPAGLRILR